MKQQVFLIKKPKQDNNSEKWQSANLFPIGDVAATIPVLSEAKKPRDYLGSAILHLPRKVGSNKRYSKEEFIYLFIKNKWI